MQFKVNFKLFALHFSNRHEHIDGIKFIKRTENTKHTRSITFKKELTKYFATQYPL